MMKCFKKVAMLCTLMSVCQTQTAEHAGKILGAVFGVSTSLLIMKSQREMRELMKDPNAKKAFEMLDAADGSLSKCSYTYSGYDYRGPFRGEVKDLSPADAYKALADNKAGQDTVKVKVCKVCKNDECVEVTGSSAYKFGFLLARVDHVRAPVMGFEAPRVRRMLNIILNP